MTKDPPLPALHDLRLEIESRVPRHLDAPDPVEYATCEVLEEWLTRPTPDPGALAEASRIIAGDLTQKTAALAVVVAGWHVYQEDYAAASALVARACPILRHADPREFAYYYTSGLITRGRAAGAMCNHQMALLSLGIAFRLQRTALGDAAPATLTTLGALGMAAYHCGLAKQAKRLLEEVVSGWTRTEGPAGENTAHAACRLGCLLVKLGEPDAAIGHFQSALAVFEPLLGRDHEETRTAAEGLVYSLRTTRSSDAERLIRSSPAAMDADETNGGSAPGLRPAPKANHD